MQSSQMQRQSAWWQAHRWWPAVCIGALIALITVLVYLGYTETVIWFEQIRNVGTSVIAAEGSNDRLEDPLRRGREQR